MEAHPYARSPLVLLAFITTAAFCVRQAVSHGVGSNDGHFTTTSATESAEGFLAGQINPPKPRPALNANNVALGFLLVGLAALFSTLGSALPFLDGLIQSESFFGGRFRNFSIAKSKAFLSVTLGISAGLLITLSLGDLMPGGAENLKKAAVFAPQHVQLVSTALFIAGFASVGTFKWLSAKVVGQRGSKSEHAVENLTHDHYGDFDRKHLDDLKGDDSDRLNEIGYQIAISLAFHNFPEGLSTFSAALLAPRVGILYGIALCLHKIPEGLMMCLPIYYSSGSRLRAFIVATLFGVLSQFAGAVMALLLFHTISPTAIAAFSGSVFSAVAGLLLYIVVGGILPMSRAADREDRFVTRSVLAGAAFFYLVLSVFSYV